MTTILISITPSPRGVARIDFSLSSDTAPTSPWSASPIAGVATPWYSVTDRSNSVAHAQNFKTIYQIQNPIVQLCPFQQDLQYKIPLVYILMIFFENI